MPKDMSVRRKLDVWMIGVECGPVSEDGASVTLEVRAA